MNTEREVKTMKVNDKVMVKSGSHFGEVGIVLNMTHDGWVQIKLDDIALWISKKAVRKA